MRRFAPLEFWSLKIYNFGGCEGRVPSSGSCDGINYMKKMDTKQLELQCDGEQQTDGSGAEHDPNVELMRRIDKVISDTTTNVRPYLNRMVKPQSMTVRQA